MRFLISFTMAVVIAFSSFASAQDPIASKSTCMISAKICVLGGCKIHNGTGIAFFKSKDRIYVMTAGHVIAYTDRIEVTCIFMHGSYKAKVVKFDRGEDLAVLLIEEYNTEAFAVTPVSNTNPDTTTTYYSYQHPGASRQQKLNRYHYKADNLLDAVSFPGASGSGICANGRLFGIVSASDFDTKQSETVVVPTEYIRSFVSPWGTVPDSPKEATPDLMEQLKKQQLELQEMRQRLEQQGQPAPQQPAPQQPAPQQPAPPQEPQQQEPNLADRGLFAILMMLARVLGLATPVGVISAGSLGTFLAIKIGKSIAKRMVKKKLGDLLGNQQRPNIPALPERTLPPADEAPTSQQQQQPPTIINNTNQQNDSLVADLFKVLLQHRNRPAAPAAPAAPATATPSGSIQAQLPPRDVTELDDNLRLAKAEGIDLHLATARGIFVNDELDLLEQSGSEVEKAIVKRIRDSLDQRITKVAPLSFKPENLR